MSELFTPLSLRDLTLKNRLTVSPMCQYSSVGGMADDWHLAHLGRFAMGGFAMVMAEASAVTPEGRISYADLGLWDDAHIAPLARVVDFLHAHGSATAIQLAHAGRKASMPVPWRPTLPDGDPELTAIGYEDWTPLGPTTERHDDGFKTPEALDRTGIARTVDAFAAAARRADSAGFDIAEIHGAHGYLIDQFLSPLANTRTDAYGGSRHKRMRFALEVVEAVRGAWPAQKPLFMRFSVQDWHPDGWQVADSVALARAVKALGVDVVDCSSGGFAGARIKPAPGYQVELAREVRKGADIPTMAVGLIDTPAAAQNVIAAEEADLIALARPALDDPNWPAHAALVLEAGDTPYDLFAPQAGYAVRAMDRVVARTGRVGN